MFKVFKKKPKSGLTPSTGPTTRSKSLFSLHKRKSLPASSLPADGSSVLSVHQSPLGYEDANSSIQTSHSSTKPDFRSFLTDGSVSASNGSVKSVEGSCEEPREEVGQVDCQDVVPTGMSTPGPVTHNKRNTWQFSGPLPGSSPQSSTSLLLEEIQNESRLRSSTSSQFLSTFRTPTQQEQTVSDISPGKLNKAKSGSSPVLLENHGNENYGNKNHDDGLRSSTPLEDEEQGHGHLEVLPVPMEFSADGPTEDTSEGCRDNHVGGNNDYDNTELLPPDGFTDSLAPVPVPAPPSRPAPVSVFPSDKGPSIESGVEGCSMSKNVGNGHSDVSENKLPCDPITVYKTSPSPSSSSASGSKPSVPNKPRHLLSPASTGYARPAGASHTTDSFGPSVSQSGNNQNKVQTNCIKKSKPNPPPRRFTMSGISQVSSDAGASEVTSEVTSLSSHSEESSHTAGCTLRLSDSQPAGDSENQNPGDNPESLTSVCITGNHDNRSQGVGYGPRITEAGLNVKYDKLNPLEHLLRRKLGPALRSEHRTLNKLETSSRLSRDDVNFDAGSISTINESQQILLSRSFLDDSAFVNDVDGDADPSTATGQVSGTLTDNPLSCVKHNPLLLRRSALFDKDYVTETTLNDSANILLSNSFLNDTVTPLMNANTPGSKSMLNTPGSRSSRETILVQDDYTPVSEESDPNKLDQPWQVSMALAWQSAISDPAEGQVGRERDQGSTTDEGSESDCTLGATLDTPGTRGSTLDSPCTLSVTPEAPGTLEDGDGKRVYRWQLKHISLWDVEDVCEWLTAKGLGTIQSSVREKELCGPELLQSALEEIGELTTNERLRQKLLHEVNLLREPRGGMSKDVDVRDSSQVMTDRLNNLQWLNQQQQHTVSQYLHRLEQEQTDAHNLLNKWSKSQLAKRPYQSIPIMKWTTSDVVDWLDSVGMEKFAPMFSAHAVTGNDLMSIDMTLLDSVGISSISDRELILSRLYELQSVSLGDAQTSKVKEIFNHPLPPPLELASGNSSVEAKSMSNTGTSEPESTKSNKNKTSRRLFDNPTDAHVSSPDKRSNSSHDKKDLTVWHDLTGVPAAVNIAIGEGTTSHDLTQQVLDRIRVSTQQSQDFSLVEVSIDATSNKVTTHTFGTDDCILDHIAHASSDMPDLKTRLEIRKRQKQIKLKIIFDVDPEISTSKNVGCSSMSTCGELLEISLQAFHLHSPDGATYSLQAISPTGDAWNTINRKLVSSYQTNTFLLKENEQAINEVISRSSDLPTEAATRSATVPLQGPSHNLSEQNSKRGTPKSKQVKVEPSNMSHDFDLTTVTDDLDLDQLSALTDDLDTLSRDTGVNSTDFEPENNNTWRHSDVLPSQQENTENEATIKRLQKEVEQTVMENKQMKKFEQWFLELERDSLQRQEDLMKKYSQLEAELLTLRTEGLERVAEEEVDVLEQALMVTGQQIQLTEQKECLIQSQIRESQAGSSTLTAYDLQEQLKVTDVNLLDLRQQQADIYRQLKLARKQVLKQQRLQLDADRFSIYKLLQELGHSPTMLYQTLAVDLDPQMTFLLGQGHGNHPFVKHCEEAADGLVKGDRILEVNGVTVTHLTESELSKVLNKDPNYSQAVVVLRKTTNYQLKVQEKIEEADSVREDLSMAMLELETAQDENRELIEQADRLQSRQEELEQQKDADQRRTEELQTKLKELQAKVQDLEIQRDQDKSKDTVIEDLQDKVYEKDQKILRLSQDFSDLQDEAADVREELEAARKQALLRVVSRSSSIRSNQRDSGFHTLSEEDLVGSRSGDNAPSEGTDPGDIVIAYQDFDLVPIWEGLQPASKEEVLQALKDQVLENHQQKMYLDRLLNVVIERAPSLIQLVDEAMGVQDQNSLAMKARTEEFC